MTRQQELELLAEWLGIDYHLDYCDGCAKLVSDGRIWNPSPEGNDTDFLNMVAGRVDICFLSDNVEVNSVCQFHVDLEMYADHNNDKVAAMKHAAYQVCLMAAGESKEGK